MLDRLLTVLCSLRFWIKADVNITSRLVGLFRPCLAMVGEDYRQPPRSSHSYKAHQLKNLNMENVRAGTSILTSSDYGETLSADDGRTINWLTGMLLLWL